MDIFTAILLFHVLRHDVHRGYIPGYVYQKVDSLIELDTPVSGSEANYNDGINALILV